MRVPKKYSTDGLDAPGFGSIKVCVFCNILPRKYIIECIKCHSYMNVCESCYHTMNESSIAMWNNNKERYIVECDACNRDKKIENCLGEN